jgi:hypothetical protein
MSQNKEINFSVNDKDLRGKIGATMDDMIRKSRQYTNSSKEVTRDLKEQIAYLEKKARLEKDMSLSKARELREYGGLKEQREANFIASTANDKYKNDRLIINLLKEQLDAINATSKNEIRENRNEVSKIVEADKSLNRLGVKGDPAENYKRLLQRDILGQLGKEEQDEKSTFQRFKKFGKDGGEIFNKASNVAVSRNEMYAVAAVLSTIPWVGQGMGNVANRLYSSAEGIGKQKEAFGVSNRMSMGSVNQFDLAGRARTIGAEYGFNAEETMARWNAYQRANLESNIFSPDDAAAKYRLHAERKLGLSQGEIQGMYGSSRHTKGGSDITQAISNLNTYLVANKMPNAMLPELVKSYNSLSANISRISYVDRDSLSRSVTGIAGASGLTGEHLERFLGATQGLGDPQDPMTRSLMMRAFRKVRPNASLWEIQKQMENPMDNLDSMSVLMEDLKNQTGGGDYYKQVLTTLFKGNLSRHEIDALVSNKKSLAEIYKSKGDKGNVEEEVNGGASDYVSEMTKSTKKMDALFQDYGNKAAIFTDKMLVKAEEALKKLIYGDEDLPEGSRGSTLDSRIMVMVAGYIVKAIKDGFDEAHRAGKTP